MASQRSGSPPPLVAVVDDDPTVIAILSRVLAADGYQVQVYTSGEALLDDAPSRPLDVICLDMSLPGLDGLQTLARLRAAGANAPTILFTASADERAGEAAAAGAFACVSKTAGWGELRALVRQALERGK